MATKIWTFGRAGLDTISRIEVLKINASDDSTEFDCEIIGDTVAKAVVTAQQIEGHLELNPIEGRGDTIPVSFVDDTAWDGLWRVEGGSIDWDAMSVAGGVIPFSISLKKVPRGFQTPLMELLSWGTTMANNQGYPVAAALVGLPSEALNVELPPLVVDTPTSYAGETATTNVYQDAEFNGGATTVRGVVPVRTSYRILAANYFKSACKLHEGADTSNVFVRTGRQVKWDSARVWVLQNDQMSIQVKDDGSGNMRLTVRHWDGAAWDSVNYDVLFDGSAVTKALAPTHAEVLYNSPERVSCVFRFQGTASVRAAYLTVTIFRGNPVASLKIKSVTSSDWGIQEAGLLDGTNTSGRFEQDAAVNGNKYILFSPDTYTVSAANGRIYLTSNGTLFRFGIGAIVNSAGSPPLSNTQLRDAYTGILGMRLYPVGV